MAVRVVVALLSAFVATTSALVLPSAQMLMPVASARTAAAPTMFFFGGPKEDKGNSNLSGRDKDFANRQDKLAARQAKSATMPKGSVEVTFPQKGNKKVVAKQGEPIGKVAQRAGLRIKFDCKNGRCATCQVRLNGRAAAKVCQGATIPGGATKKLSITLDNP